MITLEPAEGANSCTVERDYHSLTVERLRTLLKGKGLSVKGKKVYAFYISSA